MSIIFNDFKDALEEAKWCADDERVRQFIFLLKDGRYKVTPKYNSLRPKQAVVEVGITPLKYSQRRLGQK